MYLQQKIKNTNMKVFRAEHLKEGNFTRVNNGLLDGHLSSDSAIALIYFLSLPDDWNFNPNVLGSHFSWGITKVKKVLKELTEKGHLKVTQIRKKDGSFTPAYYEFFEKSINTESANKFSRCMENRSMENHTAVKQHQSTCLQGSNRSMENRSMDLHTTYNNTINTNTYINTIKPSEKIEPKKETPKAITEIKPIQKTQEVEQIENKLKDIGIQNTKYLFNNFSLDVIKRQIEYLPFRSYQNAGVLHNAIKIDEVAPKEYFDYQEKQEQYRLKDKFKYLLKTFAYGSSNIYEGKENFAFEFISRLDEIGLIETNNSVLNQENRFKFDEQKFNTLKSDIKTALTNITFTEFINFLEDSIKEFVSVHQLNRYRMDLKEKIQSDSINLLSIKKALLKFDLNKSEVI